jgi:ABC-2 type transport system permease protein
MMLFYKAWRESRARFLAGAIALAAYSIFMILFWKENQAPFSGRMVGHSYAEYVDNLVFGSFGKMAFVLPVIFLGIGGLLRERAHHTAVFSLALPVSRGQLVTARIAVGFAELALLALLPALLIQPLSALVHQYYPIADALRFSLLRFFTGAVIFAMSFLLSAVLRGDYVAPIACYIGLFLQAQLAERLRPYGVNILRAMDLRWDWRQNLPDLHGPLPWIDLAIMMLIAAAMFATATRFTQKQNL